MVAAAAAAAEISVIGLRIHFFGRALASNCDLVSFLEFLDAAVPVRECFLGRNKLNSSTMVLVWSLAFSWRPWV